MNMTNFKITALNFTPSTDTVATIKEIIAQKVNKVLPNNASASITIKNESYGFKTDVTITNIGKVHIRGEAVDEDLIVSVHVAVDDLKRRLRKFKTKKLSSNTVINSIREIAALMSSDDEKGELLPEATIMREKSFWVDEMTDEEAIARMEMLGHTFFVYKDDNKKSSSGEYVCIVYKRADGYGKLICRI